MTEQWMPVDDWDGYEVSSLGRVRSVDREVHSRNGVVKHLKGRLRVQRRNNSGYLQVMFSSPGRKNRALFVHAMVANAFIGSRPAGCDINHKDGNKNNNHPCNLEYISHRDNLRHAVKIGRQLGTRKLTPTAVLEIRERRRSGELLRVLATEYGVSESNISIVANGRTWNPPDIAKAGGLR